MVKKVILTTDFCLGCSHFSSIIYSAPLTSYTEAIIGCSWKIFFPVGYVWPETFNQKRNCATFTGSFLPIISFFLSCLTLVLSQSHISLHNYNGQRNSHTFIEKFKWLVMLYNTLLSGYWWVNESDSVTTEWERKNTFPTKGIYTWRTWWHGRLWSWNRTIRSGGHHILQWRGELYGGIIWEMDASEKEKYFKIVTGASHLPI